MSSRVVLWLVLLAAACALVAAQDLNTVNVDQVLGNRRLVSRQIKCVLGEATCDKLGKQLKDAIPEVVNRNCRSCNSRQATTARKVTTHIQQNFPKEWSLIVSKYKTG